MSTTALEGLLDYLYGTLTPSSMRWVASHLIDHANQVEAPLELKKYTMEEINAMLDEAEANMAAGRGIPDEEAWHKWDKIIDRKKEMKERALEVAEPV